MTPGWTRSPDTGAYTCTACGLRWGTRIAHDCLAAPRADRPLPPDFVVPPEPSAAEIQGGWLVAINGTMEQAAGFVGTTPPPMTEEQRWYCAWVHTRAMLANRLAYAASAMGERDKSFQREADTYEARLVEIVRYATARGWMATAPPQQLGLWEAA